MNSLKSKVYKTIIYSSLICNLGYAKGICSVYLNSNMIQTEISFQSAVTQQNAVYSGYEFAKSASRVYRSLDPDLIIKVFDSNFTDTTYAEDVAQFSEVSLPFLEMVRLRFLSDKGFTVPEVIDYSTSIFNSSTDPIVLVKSFIEGVSADELIEVDKVEFNSATGNLTFTFIPKIGSGITQLQADQLSEKMKIINRTVKDEFLIWLREQSDLTSYLELVMKNQNPHINFDNFYTNWILTPENQWILIDP